MRVVFIHPGQEVEPNYIDYPPFTSLGVWQNAAALSAAGHEVRVADAFALPDSDYTPTGDGARFGVPDERLLAEISGAPFDCAVIHLSVFDAEREGSLSAAARLTLALRAQRPEALLIVAELAIGGMHAVAYDPASRIASWPAAPDAWLRYEGEASLPALLQRLAAGRPQGAAPLILDGELCRAPLPTYDAGAYRLADLAHYHAFLRRVLAKEGRPNPFGLSAGSLPFISSRGCAYACRFCTSAQSFGGARGFRPYAAAELAAEIDALAALDPALDTLVVLDGAANLSPAGFEAVLAAARRHGLRLAIPNGLRADHLTNEQVARLAECCSLLSLSPECADPAQLALIDKRQDLAEVERVVLAAKAVGLACALHFIVGWPGESARSIHDTFRLALDYFERHGALPLVQFAVPLPGTPLFSEARAKGLLPDPLPSGWGAAFAERPVLRDGACGLSNETLIRLRAAFIRRIFGDGTKRPCSKDERL